MRVKKSLVLATFVTLAAAAVGHAQKATEMFIPIGRSPGLSGEQTRIGTVEAIDAGAETVTMNVDSGTLVIHCHETTKFWLDRSKLRLPNDVGTLEDCQPGTRIEVKFIDDDRSAAVAEWVKIEVRDD